jgi:dual 3',5'-cyclic-AMP and -GMP phosphodiesterase 11
VFCCAVCCVAQSINPIASHQSINQSINRSWKHGFAVLHFAYLTLKESGAANYLLPSDVFALVLASLCHDIDHPGNTNSFEVVSGSNRALLHNDIHVLENHHASTMFMVLRDERCNVLQNVPKDVVKQMRATMVCAAAPLVLCCAVLCCVVCNAYAVRSWYVRVYACDR